MPYLLFEITVNAEEFPERLNIDFKRKRYDSTAGY